jgi:glycosyltransferase involved in cell wall biosynthesis
VNTAMNVSVIIPTYNSEKYISSAVKSVLNQTHHNFELIIVDDGSVDNTQEIINSFNDQRIKYIYQENSGVAVARNTGIENSSGEHIAFLDADDIWVPEKLQIQLDIISERNDVCMIYSAIEMFYTGNDRTKIIKYNHDDNNFVEKLITDPFKSIPYPSTVILKRSCIDKAGTFNPEFKTGEDWDLWLRLSELGKCRYVNQPLVKKLTHNESITNSLDLKSTEEYHIKLLNKFFANNPEYKKLKFKAYSMIYYDIACRYYGRNNFIPTNELYLSLLKSFLIHPPLYLTRPKIQFICDVLIKANLKFLFDRK